MWVEDGGGLFGPAHQSGIGNSVPVTYFFISDFFDIKIGRAEEK